MRVVLRSGVFALMAMALWGLVVAPPDLRAHGGARSSVSSASPPAVAKGENGEKGEKGESDAAKDAPEKRGKKGKRDGHPGKGEKGHHDRKGKDHDHEGKARRAAEHLLMEALHGDPELRALRDDTAALKLFRALKLSPEQKAEMKPHLAKVAAAVAQARQHIDRGLADAKPVMRQIRDAYERGTTPDEALFKKLETLRRESVEAAAAALKAAREPMKAVKGLLSDDQRKAMKRFHPMPWLPEDSQLAGKMMGGALVERLRYMPAERFEKLAEKAQRKAAKGKMRLSTEQVEKFLAFAKRVRAMSDAEFAAAREKLGTEMDPEVAEAMAERMERFLERGGHHGHEDRGGPGEREDRGGRGMMGPPGEGGPGFGKAMRKLALMRIVSSPAFLKLLD